MPEYIATCGSSRPQEGDRGAPDGGRDIGRPVIKQVLQNAGDDDHNADDDQQRGFVVRLGDVRENFLKTANGIALEGYPPFGAWFSAIEQDIQERA